MPPAKMAAPEPLRLEAALSGLLAVAVAQLERESTELSRKIELILADAGLTYEEIARLIGKNVGAVRKAVERARKATA